MKNTFKILVLVFFLTLLPSFPGWAGFFIEDQKFIGQTTVTDDQFGFNVAVTNNAGRLIASAPVAGSNNGAAYIFENINGSWVETQELVASDNVADDFFGASITIDGDVAVVGATGETGLIGAAYVFRFNGSNWVEEAKLTGSDAVSGAQFGSSMKLQGNTLVVGAQNCCSSLQGAAYIFEYDGFNWVETTKIVADNGQFGNRFGVSVDLKDDVILVGANRQNAGAQNSGTTYVYERGGNGWFLRQRITPSDPAFNKNFGSAVAIGDDEIVISAPNDGSASNGSNGAAYVFERNGGVFWSEVDKITASDAATAARFGGFNQGISIDGDMMIISSLEDPAIVQRGGAAYIFKRTGSGWNEIRKFTASDVGLNWSFTRSVALQNNTVLAGAIGADDFTGAVYAFTNDVIFANGFE